MSKMLPNGFLWCRKAKYSVFIELACYEIDDKHPLLPGFIEKEFVEGGILVRRKGLSIILK